MFSNSTLGIELSLPIEIYFIFCIMARSNLRFLVFCPLFKIIVPLSINIEINGFVEIFDHVLIMKFRLHVHSLLIE